MTEQLTAPAPRRQLAAHGEPLAARADAVPAPRLSPAGAAPWC